MLQLSLDMCNPSKLIDAPKRFQQFWLNFSREYLDATPHRGYELLDEWCQGGRLPCLLRPLPNLGASHLTSCPWWIYSSNVDGHFRRFKSFDGPLCEIHGVALEYKCACGIGFSNGEARLGKEWDRWNQHVSTMELCKQTVVQMNDILLEELRGSDNIFLCCHCKQPMRPNVLMFHDTDENVIHSIFDQRAKYQAWEAQIEDDVVANNRKLVILELGCGVNVPAVRQESEEVLLDCANRIKLQCPNTESSVSMIRVNPKNAEVDLAKASTISIFSNAASALEQIDMWLKLME